MNISGIAAGAAILVAAMGAPGIADAAEIKVLASGALKLALPHLIEDFQRSSHDVVTVEYGPAGGVASRVQNGDAADVAIVTGPQLASLESQGKIVQGSRVDIAGIAVGVAIRKGAPRPDISTVDAFKRALLAARSIGYRDPATGSTSGIFTAHMLDELGIANQLRPKIKLDSSKGDHPEDVFQGLVRGDVEMQIGQITEIVIAPGVELAGPLPAAIQKVTMLAAGIVATSKVPESARAFVGFLSSPSAAAVLKANGFQPASRN
jgi:molybdate transport system substrate-binding protein